MIPRLPFHSIFLLILLALSNGISQTVPPSGESQRAGFTDAAQFGFSPGATGVENDKALQKAVEGAGTVGVSQSGTYSIAATVYLPSNTTLDFGNNVFLKKVPEQGQFSHVFINQGAPSRTWDSHIQIKGLQLIVNGVDFCTFKEAFGLRGQVAFFYAKDVRIEGFRCLDLGRNQFAIQVCTFEDLVVDDFIIKGLKDGVHLGRGKRFTIRNGSFETFDDAVALNAHDFSTSNPELGWIEDGVVENCHDLAADKCTGYFCRMLAGAWVDWHPGMEVQQSDTVVSGGRLYRVQAKPDGKVYPSLTRPTHETGKATLDGINWGVVQNDVTYSAGVRHVVFRDIFLNQSRVGFSIHFDNDKYSRSYYPGAQVPLQEGITLDNVQVLNEKNVYPLLHIATPVDVVTLRNCRFRNNPIEFVSNKAMTDYGKTFLNLIGCTFANPAPMNLVVNEVPGKRIALKTTASIQLSDKFQARMVNGEGAVEVDSDLSGLRK